MISGDSWPRPTMKSTDMRHLTMCHRNACPHTYRNPPCGSRKTTAGDRWKIIRQEQRELLHKRTHKPASHPRPSLTKGRHNAPRGVYKGTYNIYPPSCTRRAMKPPHLRRRETPRHCPAGVTFCLCNHLHTSKTNLSGSLSKISIAAS